LPYPQFLFIFRKRIGIVLIKKIFSSSLAKTSGIYTVTNIINSAIPFLMMPILTRYLTPTDYGIVAMFQVLVGLIAPFTGLSINGAVNRQYYEKDRIDFPKYVTNCLYILFCTTFIVACVMWIFAHPIGEISSFPEEWLWTVIVIASTQFIISIVLIHWQVQLKPVFYGVFQISNTILNICLSLWFVVGLGYNWQGRVIGQIITAIIFAIIAIVILKKDGWIKFGIEPKYIKHAFAFGIPIIPHALGGFLITMTDRVFITNMIGISETGLYTVGYQIGFIIGILQDGFNKAWVPWLFAKLKLDNENVKIKIVKITYAYFVAILGLALFLSLLAPWFLNLFVGDKFEGSSKYVLWIALGYGFNGMYKMVTNYIFYIQKTSILAWMTFITAVLNVGLNYILISLNGAIGAAQATATAFLLSFVFTWIISAKVYEMPWGLKMKHKAKEL
jgi:O-antigen/teichoic acid export membrane protein